MYSVVQGDCLSSIAKAFGFADWRVIYNHGSNADFRRLRPNPNLIYPGDQLFIPETDAHVETAATDAWHQFRVESQKTLFRARMLDSGMAGLSGKKYKLEVGGRVKEGILGNDGMIEQEIAPDESEATVTVWMDPDTSRPGIIWNVRLGHLDPIDTTSGIQARLQNLGFEPGPINGELTPLTVDAIKGFQSRFGLTVNGEADSPTKAKLKEVHEGA
jgi:N-acetylmuramoyl-L-alanine amidase